MPQSDTLPRLEQWELRAGCLAGLVFGDSVRADGTPVRTSSIQSVDKQEVQTANSVYWLGTPASGFLFLLKTLNISVEQALRKAVLQNRLQSGRPLT